jgi:rubredoxin
MTDIKQTNLYRVVNAMMAELGAEGEIRNGNPIVGAVMSELHEIDRGVPCAQEAKEIRSHIDDEGQYEHNCPECGLVFYGGKGRRVCRTCPGEAREHLHNVRRTLERGLKGSLRDPFSRSHIDTYQHALDELERAGIVAPENEQARLGDFVCGLCEMPLNREGCGSLYEKCSAKTREKRRQRVLSEIERGGE